VPANTKEPAPTRKRRRGSMNGIEPTMPLIIPGAVERELNRKDRLTTKIIKRFRNKSDLLKDLQAKGVSAKGTKDELQILCKNKTYQFKRSWKK
jgi:hypothetical protein